VATVSCGGTSERYQFIKRFGKELGVKYTCNWLGVSTSGYYDWRLRKPSNRELADAELTLLIKDIYDDSEGRYGSPRVYRALQKKGIYVGKTRVERLMRTTGLVARVTQVTRSPSGLKHYLRTGENLRFGGERPTAIDQVWVADITYLKVMRQWVYLSVIMDLYSRRIIGWSLDESRTTALTKRTFQNALQKRNAKEGLIFHTDRGVEYRGQVFQDELKRNGFQHSLNRLGHCTDNGHMESFFHSMKGELTRGRTYNTMDELRYELAGYINQFYNAKRLHSGIGYYSPIEYEQLVA